MKKLTTLLSTLALAGTVFAQSNTPPPAISGPASDAWSFLTTTGVSNWMVAPYGIYSTDNKLGAGIGVGYRVSDFVVPTLRLDYLDKEVWMPSGSLQLQVPVTIMGKLTLIPFAFSGLATPVSGTGPNNGSAAGIFGAGAAVRIGTHWDLIGDYERWTGFKGDQVRFGFVYKF